jgi:tetratricopeptide (TPR) repeat protein
MRSFVLFIFALLTAVSPTLADALPSADKLASQGEFYAKHRRYDEALQCFQQGIKADPKFAKNYWLAARMLEGVDRHQESIDLLSKGLAVCPPDGHMFYFRCNAYYAVGSRDKARADIQRAIEIDAHDPYYVMKRADLELDAHDNESALKDYNKTIDVIKADSSADKATKRDLAGTHAMVEIFIANIYRNTGKFQLAVDHYTTALNMPALVTHREHTLTDRASCYDKLGKHDLAAADRKAAAVGSNDVLNDLMK